MDRLTLTEIVDRCIDDITTRGATVEMCLSRWPQEREALEPILRAAMALHGLPEVAPVTVPAPERRAAFMAQIAQTPQQRPRRRLPRVALPTLGFGGLLGRLVTVTATAAAIAVVAFVLVLSRGATPAAAATLTVFGGSVEQEVQGSWRAVDDGTALVEGARIRTGTAGRALVTFGDGSTVTLEPGTEVALARLRMEGAREITIEQQAGRLWHDIVNTNGVPGSYVVRTLDVQVEARGTVFQTRIDPVTLETAVATLTGIVDVVSGEARVSLVAGEEVRVAAQQITPVRAVEVAASVSVDAGTTATLMAEDGAATGARKDGLVVRQIPGIATAQSEAGGQQFFFGDTPPGIYTLWLSRQANGTDPVEGDREPEVVLQTPAGEVRLPLPAAGAAASVRVAIEVVKGRTTLRTLDALPQPVATVPAVRVVETTRNEGKPATPARSNRDATANPTASPTATATPEATSAATETPTANAIPDATATSTASPDVTATATPSATPDVPAAIEVPARASEFRRVLDAALDGGDDPTIRALLASIVEANDRVARERLEIVDDLTRRRASREALQISLAGAEDGLAGKIEARAEDLLRGNARIRLRALLSPRLPVHGFLGHLIGAGCACGGGVWDEHGWVGARPVLDASEDGGVVAAAAG